MKKSLFLFLILNIYNNSALLDIKDSFLYGQGGSYISNIEFSNLMGLSVFYNNLYGTDDDSPFYPGSSNLSEVDSFYLDKLLKSTKKYIKAILFTLNNSSEGSKHFYLPNFYEEQKVLLNNQDDTQRSEKYIDDFFKLADKIYG